jgi:sugar diacid utilization regulator
MTQKFAAKEIAWHGTDGFSIIGRTFRNQQERRIAMYKLKTEISKMEIRTIFALADCGLNPTMAAIKLNVHRNTVIYHIGEIKDYTGLDPLNFYDMVKLLEKYKEKENG